MPRPRERGRRPRLGLFGLCHFFGLTLAAGCPEASGATVSAEAGGCRGSQKLDFKTFFKLPFVLKTVVLSIFEWPLKRGLLYKGSNYIFQRTITCYLWNHQH